MPQDISFDLESDNFNKETGARDHARRGLGYNGGQPKHCELRPFQRSNLPEGTTISDRKSICVETAVMRYIFLFELGYFQNKNKRNLYSLFWSRRMANMKNVVECLRIQFPTTRGIHFITSLSLPLCMSVFSG